MTAPLRRFGPLGLALAGCVLLVVAEFSRLYEIKVITVIVHHASVGSHHGFALAIIACVSALLAFAAAAGSRPAAWAGLVLAVAALVIVLAVDLPVVDDTGLYGKNYEQAAAQAASGFYLETAGAIVLLLGAVLRVALPVRTSSVT